MTSEGTKVAIREWSVLVEARSNSATIETDDKRIIHLTDGLHLHFGVVSAGGSAWSARITVEAEHARPPRWSWL